MDLSIPPKYSPARKHRKNALIFLAVFGLAFILSVLIGFNPLMLITELPYAIAFIQEILPPNFGFVFRKPDVLLSIFSTLAMAFLGTLIGGILAFMLAFFAARNVTPKRWVSMLVYTLFTLERVIPSFILLLFFLIIAGIGPFAGTLALTVATIGTFGKLFAEAMEQVRSEVLNAMKSTGASRSQWIKYGLLPEAAPAIIGNFFYAFDVNIRRAIGLGIFGGGGLGFDLYIAMGMMEYSSAFALMIVIVALVFLSEQLSSYLRDRVMRG